jgi:ABC-type uncharacterized transport system involved in gliding motility auxiliary subunit
LILSGPKEPFNDYEMYQIDQFLMKGKSLALFLDPYIEVKLPQSQMQYNRQQPVYRPVNTDLEKILEHYGLTTEKSYVLDINCFEQRIPQAYGGGTRQLYFAPMIKNEKINEDLVFMKNIKGLIMLLSSPVKLLNNTLSQNGLRGDVVFSSSPESWTMSGRIDLNPWSLQPPADQTQLASQPLAALVQGEFSSYFAGRGIPEKPAKEELEEAAAGEGGDLSAQDAAATLNVDAGSGAGPNEFKDFSQAGALIKKGGLGKIFLIGSSEILKDNVIDEQGSSTNATFVLNVLDELNNRNEYAEMRSKAQRFNPLGDTGPGMRAFVKAFNIAGLPIIVVVFGVLVWVRRNARKRAIEAMFNR